MPRRKSYHSKRRSSDILLILDQLSRNTLPILTTIVFCVLSLLPLHLVSFTKNPPDFFLVAVFYWALHCARLLPLGFVLLLGAVLDLLMSAPLGVTSLIMVLTHVVIGNRYEEAEEITLAQIWLMFIITAVVVLLVRYIIGSILLGDILPFMPLLFQYMLTIVLYPLLSWGLSMVRHLIIIQED